MRGRHRLPLLCLAALLASGGCGDGVDRYGQMSAGAVEMDIASLLDAPELHLGKEVRLTGTVVQVCQEMGCWFEITDGERRLMVDLELGRSFTIPESSTGRRAAVTGTFSRLDGVLKVIGRGVELRDPGAS